jgi:hypothetical protein
MERRFAVVMTLQAISPLLAMRSLWIGLVVVVNDVEKGEHRVVEKNRWKDVIVLVAVARDIERSHR